MQDIQYNTISTVQYNTMQGNPQYAKYYQKNQEHILYSIKTQKRVEPKVHESFSKTTRYTKQTVNHITEYSKIYSIKCIIYMVYKIYNLYGL